MYERRSSGPAFSTSFSLCVYDRVCSSVLMSVQLPHGWGSSMRKGMNEDTLGVESLPHRSTREVILDVFCCSSCFSFFSFSKFQ